MTENENNPKKDDPQSEPPLKPAEQNAEGAPEVPEKAGQPLYGRSVSRDAEFKNLRTLVMIAGIGGPFSFIIGGVFLSTIALICGIMAFGKFKRLYSGSQGLRDSDRIKRAIIISIVISALGLVWNAVWLAMALPQLMEIIQSQDYSSLYNGTGSGAGSSGDKTIWD